MEFYATDLAGNVESLNSVVIKIDKSVPTTGTMLLGTAGNPGWFRSSVSVILIPIDPISGIAGTWYRLDGSGNFSTYAGPFVVSGQGAHQIEYYSMDVAGNIESVGWSNFSIDIVAPDTTAKVTGTLGLNGWNTTAVVINLTSTDVTSGVAGIMYRINGGGWSQYVSDIVLSTDGVYTVEYYAADNAGNLEATTTLSFKVDQTAPVTRPSVQGMSGLAGWNTSAVTLTLTPSDAQSGVSSTCYRLVADGPFIEYTAPLVFSTDGIHVIEFYSIDMAGNVEATGSITIKVDTTSPNLALTGPVEESYHNVSLVRVSWMGNDAESGLYSYYLQLDTNEWFTLSALIDRFIFDLDDGHHTVKVKAMDVAGKSVTRVVNFTVDTVPPEAVSHSPQGSEELRNVTIMVEFSETMVQDSITLVVNGVQGTTVRTSTSAIFTPTELLTYNTTFTVTVTGRDLAGNSMTYVWTFSTKAGTGTVTGIVLDEEGKPIANADVRLAGGPNATTDSNGRYWLNATQGYYTMWITAPGMENMTFGVFIQPDQIADVGAKKMAEISEGFEHFLIWIGLVVAIVVAMIVLAVYLRRRRKA
jgi:hypothetical protein